MNQYSGRVWMRSSMRSARLEMMRESTAGTAPRAGSSTHANVVVPGISAE